MYKINILYFKKKWLLATSFFLDLTLAEKIMFNRAVF